MNASPHLLGGRYEVGALLGRGGMAEVHVGRDTRLGRSVAIKMLRPDLARDPSFQNRFRREAQAAAALNHPAVVAVYDSGEEPVAPDEISGAPGVAVPYIVMEYVEGHTLREVLRRGQPLLWEEALRITSGVLAALGYSHRSGIVHRDIKPANVMLTPSGDVKVMDFGIARALADSAATMTQTQAVIGTAQYLSPEQARGETVDARSDLYSAGCLLYELLTGRPPFTADSPVAVAYQHVGEAAKPPSQFEPTVPPQVDAIVLHSLTKDRDLRYQNADEFRDDVRAAMNGSPISSAALGSVGATTSAARSSFEGFGARQGGVDADPTQALPPVALSDATVAMAPAGGYGGYGAGSGGVADSGNDASTSMLPQGLEDKKNRTGLWVLLALLGVALVAVTVLVLSQVLGSKDPVIPQVAVPQLVGKTEAQAQTLLATKGLSLGTTTKENSDTVDEGSIISQSPTEGTMLAKGKSVDYVVSLGKGEVVVPDLTGLKQDKAEDALKDEGLTLGKVNEVDSSDQSKGRVVSSSPSSGDSATKGTAVDIEIASGKILVPNVVGDTVDAATSTLTDAGLKVDATQFEESSQPAGTIISQSVSGKTVDQGTKIVLVVAKPLTTPTTPPDDGGETTAPPTP